MKSTQIGGGCVRNMAKVIGLKEMFESLGVTVAHPDMDEFSFYEKLKSGWQKYETELAFFESIGTSSFHVACNDAPIGSKLAQQILYAMLKQKAVILCEEQLTFANDVSTFAQRTIRAHSKQLYFADITTLHVAEAKNFVDKLPAKVDYQLTDHEAEMINLYGKGHFRSLIEHARMAYLKQHHATIAAQRETSAASVAPAPAAANA